MSKAREIAEERLAKGEITKAEFDEIVSALEPAPAAAAEQTDSPQTIEPATTPSPDTVDIKPIIDLRNGLHYGGGLVSILVTAIGGYALLRFVMSREGLLEDWLGIAQNFGITTAQGLEFVLMAIFGGLIWIVAGLVTDGFNGLMKTQLMTALNDTPNPQATLAALTANEPNLDNHFTDQYKFTPMPNETGEIKANQVQVKLVPGGAFLGALGVFFLMSWLF